MNDFIGQKELRRKWSWIDGENKTIQEKQDDYFPKSKTLRLRFKTAADYESYFLDDKSKALSYGMPGWDSAPFEMVFIVNPKIIHE